MPQPVLADKRTCPSGQRWPPEGSIARSARLIQGMICAIGRATKETGICDRSSSAGHGERRLGHRAQDVRPSCERDDGDGRQGHSRRQGTLPGSSGRRGRAVRGGCSAGVPLPLWRVHGGDIR
eukprot:scaffold2808_cov255-Pinguiococcus_pyrenoidosus.AAC.40